MKYCTYYGKVTVFRGHTSIQQFKRMKMNDEKKMNED
jgi:hypothetical protein